MSYSPPNDGAIEISSKILIRASFGIEAKKMEYVASTSKSFTIRVPTWLPFTVLVDSRLSSSSNGSHGVFTFRVNLLTAEQSIKFNKSFRMQARIED